VFEIADKVRAKTPLVHCITNYVTVNDCANILLACGGSPIMADDEAEAAEITAMCGALVINIGTLNARTIVSMHKAGKMAKALNHPVVLDPVGAGASALRTQTALSLIHDVKPAVIRGNISEIKACAQGGGTTKGVDADPGDAVTEETLDSMVAFAKRLSERTGAVIAVTGATDIVADAARAYAIRNGHPLMSRITGTGCMLSAITGAFCGARPESPLDATAAAVCAMGVCGELAHEKLMQAGGGTATYRTLLIDAMSALDAATLEARARVEQR
jgi:hydroxyethylthiazole kinase